MSRYVIDAGIAVKWFLTEMHSDKARRLLEQYQRQAVELTAPDLLLAEATNVFWKRAARGDLTTQEAADNLQDLLAINLPLVPATSLARSALSLAQTHNRSVYDCLYLALALERNCEFVTKRRTPLQRHRQPVSANPVAARSDFVILPLTHSA